MNSNKHKKIILLTQFCEPEPQHVGIAFANKLYNIGYEVEVVTGFPNYPGGKLYEGYKLRLRDTRIEKKIKLTRLWLFLSHSQSKLGRVANYLSFALSSFLYLVLNAKKDDIIYVYHPPITVGITACLIKLFIGPKIILDIQDFWPDTLAATGFIKNKFILRLIGFFCNVVYKRSDYLLVLSKGFKEKLINMGLCKDNISVIYNWADDEEAYLNYSNTDTANKLLNPESFNILHAGNIGPAQGLESLVKAAKILKNKGNNNIQFIFLGDGVSAKKLKKYAKEINSNVLFLPRVDSKSARVFMEEADVMCVHLINDPLFKITIPSKIQAYMASSRPILAAVDGEAGELVVESKSGFKAKSSDEESIAEAALKLFNLSEKELNLMGDNGKKFYLDKMALNQAILKTDKIIKLLS